MRTLLIVESVVHDLINKQTVVARVPVSYQLLYGCA